VPCLKGGSRTAPTFSYEVIIPAVIHDHFLGKMVEASKNISFFIKNILTLKIA